MKNANRKLLTYLMAATLILGNLSLAVPASAAETYDFKTKPRSGDMLLDAFLMRPVMLVGTVAGAATFLVTLPFSALGGNMGDAAETLVVEPAEYTFLRPLGDI
jgi:hypothetical protein